jgi:hypothetical protein
MCDSTTKLAVKITNYTFCKIIGEKYYPRHYFPVLNFAPTGLLMIQTMDRLLILAKTFSEKLFQMFLDRIECDGKNRFLSLSFEKLRLMERIVSYTQLNNLSFTYINIFSKK